VVPGKIEGETPDAQVAFLDAGIALVRDQVLQRATDPARREALIEMTERLNPMRWTDADAITAGLPKRRRRTRTPVAPVRQASPAHSTPAAAAIGHAGEPGGICQLRLRTNP
jgi:hypothetical protein